MGRDTFSDEYSPTMAVQGRQLLNQDADKLAVVFPPWHGGGKITEALVKRLQKRDWAVLNYDFHDQILEPDLERVPQSFEAIQAEVVTELELIQETAPYREIHFIGISLGNVAMALVASEYPDFSSASVVTAGSNLALSMWEGSRTKNIAKKLSARGIKKEELDDAWHELAPMTHAKAFRAKEVSKFISERDKIIPTKYQFEMSAALSDAGARVSNRYSRLGHAVSVTSFCYKGGKI